MKTLGVRASAKDVLYAILNSPYNDLSDLTILDQSKISLPQAMNIPDRLKFLRSNIIDILSEYEIDNAGVKITEYNADAATGRVLCEGVIQEAFASSELKSFYIATSSPMMAKVGMKNSDYKDVITGVIQLPISGWEELGKDYREVVLCAMGAIYA